MLPEGIEMDVKNGTNLLPIFPKEEEEMDWSYNMRREMQEIIPRLYLGPYSVASKSELESLRAAGITHIVCVRQPIHANHIKPNFPLVFQRQRVVTSCVKAGHELKAGLTVRYLVVDIEDSETQNIIQYFPQVNDFILTCLRAGGRALVHGMTGCSRSASLVQAFIMRYCGLACHQAFTYMQKRRFCVCPSPHFVQQLQAYEPMCSAYNMESEDQAAQQRQSRKRKWEEESSVDMDVCMS